MLGTEPQKIDNAGVFNLATTTGLNTDHPDNSMSLQRRWPALFSGSLQVNKDGRGGSEHDTHVGHKTVGSV